MLLQKLKQVLENNWFSEENEQLEELTNAIDSGNHEKAVQIVKSRDGQLPYPTQRLEESLP